MQNLYEILGVSKDADKIDIKKAYFRIIKSHSPEKDPNGFKLIRNAYDTLSEEKSRAEYDNIIDVPDEYLEAILTSHNYMETMQYKKAVEILKKLDKQFSDQLPIRKALGEAYYHNGNLGNATKIYEKLTADYPTNQELGLFLAKIYSERNFDNKAINQYEKAVALNETKANAWIEYIGFWNNKYPWNSIETLISRAERASSTIFNEHYTIYLLIVNELIRVDNSKSAAVYFQKYVNLFMSAPKISMSDYETALDTAYKLKQGSKFHPAIQMMLPKLEGFELRLTEHDKKLEEIKKVLSTNHFDSDMEIHDVLKDLTKIILKNCDCERCKLDRFSMEFYIINHLSLLRTSIKYMREKYPEFYKLNGSFYGDVLNQKKQEYIINKARNEYKKWKKKYPAYFDEKEDSTSMFDLDNNELEFYDNFDIMDFINMNDLDEFIDTEPMVPIVRNQPKIGRNDPCPCGSGKKYKRCCGM